MIKTSIESLREAQETIAGQWKGSLLYSMVADAITELETARKEEVALRAEVEWSREECKRLRRIAKEARKEATE